MQQTQETSQEAFKSIKHKLSKAQDQVLDVLKHYSDLTNMEIATHLEWEINRVVPRVYELRKKGKVIQSQVRQCDITHRDVIAWKTRPGNEFMEKFEKDFDYGIE